jgi:hypothetical protein
MLKKFYNQARNLFGKEIEVKPIRREFKVGHVKDHESDDITSYFVTDAHDNKEIDLRPQLMTFPISMLYPAEDQRQRADEYATYMNKIVEATHQAYENNQLLEVLKGTNNG